MLDGLKLIANKRDIPYQSLIKVFLAERIEQELKVKYPLSPLKKHSRHPKKGCLVHKSILCYRFYGKKWLL
jgi:hypothetical protein